MPKVGGDHESIVPTKTFMDLAPGATITVYLMLEFNAPTRLNLRIDSIATRGVAAEPGIGRTHPR